MRNELLLIGSVVLIYGAVLLGYRLFGKTGIYAMTVIATILANIEVLMMIDGFGMEQTLGNVMFASTYLITDILSENEGEKSATRAVWLGVFTSGAMLIFSQYWLLYIPSASDWAGEHIRAIFSTTPRLMLASFLGYVVSQRIDVWLYHRLVVTDHQQNRKQHTFSLAAQQWLNADFSGNQYPALFAGCLRGLVRHQNPHFNYPDQLCGIHFSPVCLTRPRCIWRGG